MVDGSADAGSEGTPEGSDSSVGTTSQEEGTTLTATLTNRRLISRLGAFIKTELGTRRLSDDAFTSGLAAQRPASARSSAADAVITNNTLELKSDSLPLLQDVQLVLLGFGVQSAILDGGAVAYGGLPDRRMIPTSSGSRSPRGDADYRRHGLRIDPGSLRTFYKFVGLLSGKKSGQLNTLVSLSIDSRESSGNWERLRDSDSHRKTSGV